MKEHGASLTWCNATERAARDDARFPAQLLHASVRPHQLGVGVALRRILLRHLERLRVRQRIERAKDDWRSGRFPKVPGDEQEFIPLPDE